MTVHKSRPYRGCGLEGGRPQERRGEQACRRACAAADMLLVHGTKSSRPRHTHSRWGILAVLNQPEPGQQALRFVASPWRQMVVLGDHPLVILERGLPWDDHGYKTLFQIYYYEPGKDDEPQRLGAVKLLQRGAKVTSLPHEESDGLDASFCSLGTTGKAST